MKRTYYSTPELFEADYFVDASVCANSTAETSIDDMPETNMDITF